MTLSVFEPRPLAVDPASPSIPVEWMACCAQRPRLRGVGSYRCDRRGRGLVASVNAGSGCPIGWRFLAEFAPQLQGTALTARLLGIVGEIQWKIARTRPDRLDQTLRGGYLASRSGWSGVFGTVVSLDEPSPS